MSESCTRFPECSGKRCCGESKGHPGKRAGPLAQRVSHRRKAIWVVLMEITRTCVWCVGAFSEVRLWEFCKGVVNGVECCRNFLRQFILTTIGNAIVCTSNTVAGSEIQKFGADGNNICFTMVLLLELEHTRASV